MKFQVKLILSLSAIGLIVLVGLATIYQSVSSVVSIAEAQKRQVDQQRQTIEQLQQGVSTVAPALSMMNEIAGITNELNQVQYAFANASLTLDQVDLDRANLLMDGIEPKIIGFLNRFPQLANEGQAVREALWASRIFGNKMNEFLLDDLPNIAGDMARGLGSQMDIIANVLNRLSEQSTNQVNSNLNTVTRGTEAVNTSAQDVSTNSDLILEEAGTVSSVVLAVALVILLLTAAIAVSITRSLRSATKQVVKVLHNISLDKNLTLRINRDSNDELGTIAKDVDHMMDNFEKVVVEVNDTASNVGQEICEMSQRGSALNQLICDLQQSVDSISTAVVELSASASEVSNNAGSTAETTRQANSIGSKGTQIVESSINNVENLSNVLHNSQGSVQQLEKDVGSIGGILEVIESIAEQTNLLALNAAIEAARAGEQGRGFAVVADEVRSLASRTQQSTVEIRQTINNLQDRTHDVVSTMQSAINASGESVQQAREASAAIGEISNSLSEILDLNQLIATAAREQSDVANEISDRITILSNSAQDISNLAEQNEAGGKRMSAQGDKLGQAVAIFNLG